MILIDVFATSGAYAAIYAWGARGAGGESYDEPCPPMTHVAVRLQSPNHQNKATDKHLLLP